MVGTLPLQVPPWSDLAGATSREVIPDGAAVAARARVNAAGIHRLAAGGDPMDVALPPVAADLEQAAREIEALLAPFWLYPGRVTRPPRATADTAHQDGARPLLTTTDALGVGVGANLTVRLCPLTEPLAGVPSGRFCVAASCRDLNPRQEAHLVARHRIGEHSTAELGDLFGVAPAPSIVPCNAMRNTHARTARPPAYTASRSLTTHHHFGARLPDEILRAYSSADERTLRVSVCCSALG